LKQSTLDAALEYAANGFRVLPLIPGTKTPALRNWPEEAGRDPDIIRRQWAATQRRNGGADPNVGIACGNGLAVLDIDHAKGGEIPAWAPDTYTVTTPSGGFHLYYDVSLAVPNSVERVMPGVDVRGERGQVAAPPSRTDPGVYAVLHDRPIASIDAQLLIPEDVKHGFEGIRKGFRYVDVDNRSTWLGRDEPAPVGTRNNYLCALAGYLYAQGETESEVLEALRTESDSLGFDPRQGELEYVARSIARYHTS
jgi:hypothetical protein